MQEITVDVSSSFEFKERICQDIILAYSTRPGKRTPRTGWPSTEEEELLRAVIVGSLGGRWKTIRDEYPILSKYTNGAIKDKWRNITKECGSLGLGLSWIPQ